eukprot:158430-Chlamydomonas_euryale.AAC.2
MLTPLLGPCPHPTPLRGRPTPLRGPCPHHCAGCAHTIARAVPTPHTTVPPVLHHCAGHAHTRHHYAGRPTPHTAAVGHIARAVPHCALLRPLPSAAAFPFFYIEPGSPKNAPLTQKFTGKLTATQRDEIAPIGNSPTFMTLKDMAMVCGERGSHVWRCGWPRCGNLGAWTCKGVVGGPSTH